MSSKQDDDGQSKKEFKLTTQQNKYLKRVLVDLAFREEFRELLQKTNHSEDFMETLSHTLYSQFLYNNFFKTFPLCAENDAKFWRDAARGLEIFKEHRLATGPERGQKSSPTERFFMTMRLRFGEAIRRLLKTTKELEDEKNEKKRRETRRIRFLGSTKAIRS
jgi:hypothetical protein